MTTRLVKPLKREIEIAGSPCTLVISKDGFRLTGKRMRRGVQRTWREVFEQADVADWKKYDEVIRS